MKLKDAPDRMYPELFEAVQSRHLFGDSKTFVDATAKTEPAQILSRFKESRKLADFDLAEFIEAHFDLPEVNMEATSESKQLPVEERIEQLWDALTRAADERVEYSSLIPLPNPYVVPGGRFREVYYWDSYFTMLGLADSGRTDLIRDMVENFAYLIDEIGFIPNGNRTYFCSRSQPPFFALMVDLLADISDDEAVYERFLPHLKREYDFWMAGSDALSPDTPAKQRVVMTPGGYLNRYWDDEAIPRQESYAEDVELAAGISQSTEQLYRDIRAGAESGWDYSSRWFADQQSMETVRTTQVVPVDLNTLIYNLEATLARVSQSCGDADAADLYRTRAEARRKLLQSLFFDNTTGMFMDLALPDLKVTGALSIAAAYPLFFGVATQKQGELVAKCINQDFLKAGGWLTTLRDTGQQWDRPNGWAPMQWVTYCGLKRYGFHAEARTGAERWINNNMAVYRAHGRLLEKYNVESTGTAGSGGEYDVQDGFGWTNAILLRLIQSVADKHTV